VEEIGAGLAAEVVPSESPLRLPHLRRGPIGCEPPPPRRLFVDGPTRTVDHVSHNRGVESRLEGLVGNFRAYDLIYILW